MYSNDRLIQRRVVRWRWEGAIEGWVHNYVQHNHWKVRRTIPDRDDLYQEAYVKYLECRRAYPNVGTPQHFMALFKTAYSRRFMDLAEMDTASRCLVSDTDISLQEVAVETDGMLAVMIRQAPVEVRMVLSLFLNAPQEVLDAMLQGHRNKSRRVNELLGLDPDLDSMQMVEDYFTK